MIARFLFLAAAFFAPLVSAQVVITEFLASNDNGLEDENGDDEDWIELANLGAVAVDLDGWSLTDNATNTQKWIFPAISLAPGEILVVFASNKDRSVPGLTLHTNFKLSKDGEFLGLYEPGGANVATEFAPMYPPQAEDVSYGVQQGFSEEIVVTLGTPGRAGVPTSQSNFNSQFSNWNESLTGSFNGSSWQAAEMGVGYETNTGYGGWIGTGGDVEAKMDGNNASVFIRVPFTVTNASEITATALRMRWDDGFIAYLNGVQIAEHNEPVSPAWDSTSMGLRNDALNEDQTQFNIDLMAAPLNEGSNILAFHGVNESSGSSDMLVQPELVLTRMGGASSTPVYFTTPTPGISNDTGEVGLARMALF